MNSEKERSKDLVEALQALRHFVLAFDSLGWRRLGSTFDNPYQKARAILAKHGWRIE